VYMAECDLPGLTPEHLAASVERVRWACAQGAGGGAPVRHLHTLWVPADWRASYLFEAHSAGAVEAVCRAAHIPFLRVVEVVGVE
jgi:hypothetical protein